MAASSPGLSIDPRSLSYAVGVGALRSSSPIGLMLIQNIESSGRTITSATLASVGPSRPHANPASRFCRGPTPDGGTGLGLLLSCKLVSVRERDEPAPGLNSTEI